jgi:uroporphyrinogen-III synthase
VKGGGSAEPRRPLAGRRVVVTRAADQEDRLTPMLLDAGAIPVKVPLIRIDDPADGGAALVAALQRLDEFDWIVLTSPNGASRVRDAISPGSLKVAVVGRATERALGVAADLVPDEQTGARLVEAFPPAEGDGRVLVIEPERTHGEAEVVIGLRAKGWQVEAVAGYRTTPVVPRSEDVVAARSADAVLFASGSAVRSWVRAFGTDAAALVVVIGPSTAAVAGELGLKVDRVATDHSLPGLLAALVAALSGPG